MSSRGREGLEVAREVVRDLREHRLQVDLAQHVGVAVVVGLLVELDRSQDRVLDGRDVECGLPLHA